MGKTSKVAYEFLKNENADLRVRLEDAEMLAERRKWGAQEMDRLRAKLATAEKDTARLDWLIDESLRIPTKEDEREPFPGDGDEVVMLFVAESVEEISRDQYQAGVRATIDGAEARDQQ